MFVLLRKIIRRCLKIYFFFRVKRNVKKIGVDAKINGITIVNNKTVLGDNFNSNGLKIIGMGGVTIGNNFHCGFGCNIITDNHNYLGMKIPYDDTYITSNTVIGDNVWLGINVTILPGVSIGEGAIIQAGSVVVRNIPPLSIAGGHPATIFAERDRQHYFELKNKRAFH